MTVPTAPPGSPRHWDNELGGVRWIPRLIDKSRFKLNGTLGAWLCGNSPVDQALLKRLKLTTDEFVDIVRKNPDDAGVLADLQAHAWDEDALKKWSDNFHQRYASLIALWEFDEGYVACPKWKRPFRAFFHRFERHIMGAFRKISPAP